MRAILIGSTRIVLDKIASYTHGPAGPNSGQVHLSLVGEAPDTLPWVFNDPEGRILATLDHHFQLLAIREART